MARAAFTVIIPARMGSERLPGKPLRPIAGRPMIVWVLELAWSSGAEHVVVATDDEAVAAVAQENGGQAVLTRPEHPTGTDRIAEVVGRLRMDEEAIIVNLQGDEPLMPPALLRTAAEDLAARSDASIATLATPLDSTAIEDTNQVKVVSDNGGYALYFSRAAIPWPRDGVAQAPARSPWRRHLGIYAYKASFLRCFPDLEAPPLEQLERLEQLRALWHGYRVHIAEVGTGPEPGVDTEADLQRVSARLTGESPR